jgi:hypothetical protein
MGLDDRDYMRERRRREVGQTRWNDGRARVEAAWLDSKHPSHRRSRLHSVSTRSRLYSLVTGLCALIMLIHFYGEAQRKGWIPDFKSSEPFPETGSVTVARSIRRAAITSLLTVATSEANAVVQLFDPETNAHVLSVYVAGNKQITIPAPSGTFRMRLIEGQKWHGPKRYFGPNTSYETVVRLMTFAPRAGHIIDLHRRPDGNLNTRLIVSGPEPL